MKDPENPQKFEKSDIQAWFIRQIYASSRHFAGNAREGKGFSIWATLVAVIANKTNQD